MRLLMDGLSLLGLCSTANALREFAAIVLTLVWSGRICQGLRTTEIDEFRHRSNWLQYRI